MNIATPPGESSPSRGRELVRGCGCILLVCVGVAGLLAGSLRLLYGVLNPESSNVPP